MERYLKSNFGTGANLEPLFLKCALSAYVIFTRIECKYVDVLCVQKHTANVILKCIEHNLGLICISLKITYCPKNEQFTLYQGNFAQKDLCSWKLHVSSFVWTEN